MWNCLDVVSALVLAVVEMRILALCVAGGVSLCVWRFIGWKEEFSTSLHRDNTIRPAKEGGQRRPRQCSCSQDGIISLVLEIIRWSWLDTNQKHVETN